tara:strand:+ start:12516 stop:13067 length:552 start_codon:yes stop_codon:yes gene_type:complete
MTDAGVIERRFVKGDAASVAVYSECEAYRYALTRVWDATLGRVMFIMLNPSTATEVQNDPTVERCERRARVLGYGAFRVVNIFAYRATDPRVLKQAAEPHGPMNDTAILDGLGWADTVIAGWGAHGAHLGRGAEIAGMLARSGCTPMHLGLSKAGHPRHPLYIAYAQQPEIWTEQEHRALCAS